MSYLGVFRLQGRDRDVRKDNHAPQNSHRTNLRLNGDFEGHMVCSSSSPAVHGSHGLCPQLRVSGPKAVFLTRDDFVPQTFSHV